MNEQDTDEFRIATAVDWANFSSLPGIPKNFTPADAKVLEGSNTWSEREGGEGEVSMWEVKCWTILLRGAWAVDLDSKGVPVGQPRRIGR